MSRKNLSGNKISILPGEITEYQKATSAKVRNTKLITECVKKYNHEYEDLIILLNHIFSRNKPLYFWFAMEYIEDETMTIPIRKFITFGLRKKKFSLLEDWLSLLDKRSLDHFFSLLKQEDECRISSFISYYKERYAK